MQCSNTGGLSAAENKSGRMAENTICTTGALLSTVSFNEGQSVPGIAHGVVIENIKRN